MKVKELVKLLKEMDQEATVISKEYQGWSHSIHEAKHVVQFKEKETVTFFENHSSVSSVCPKTGMAKRSVVYIN